MALSSELAAGQRRRRAVRTCTRCHRPYALTMRSGTILCRFCGHIRLSLTIDLRPFERTEGGWKGDRGNRAPGRLG